ncbi:unnamed protein product [Phaeothamnion confervicola]
MSARGAGVTPIHWAVFQGKKEKLREMLDARDPDSGERQFDVNAKDKYGQTPAHMACYRGAADLLQILIDAGADVMCVDKNGNTLAHAAAGSGSVDALTLLVAADVRVGSANTAGEKPADVATQHAPDELRDAMLDYLKKTEAEQAAAPAVAATSAGETNGRSDALVQQLSSLLGQLSASPAGSGSTGGGDDSDGGAPAPAPLLAQRGPAGGSLAAQRVGTAAAVGAPAAGKAVPPAATTTLLMTLLEHKLRQSDAQTEAIAAMATTIERLEATVAALDARVAVLERTADAVQVAAAAAAATAVPMTPGPAALTVPATADLAWRDSGGGENGDHGGTVP